MNRIAIARTSGIATVLMIALAACGSGGAEETSTAQIAASTTATPVTGPTLVESMAAEPGEPESTATEPSAIEPVETELPTTDPATAIGPRMIEHQYGTTEVPADPERIVALSEEFLLADLLALGITPVASSSNSADGFGGIDPALTASIEITTTATFNIEQVAAFRPDLILAYPIYIELVGYDTLNAVAPTVAIGDDDSDWRERLQLTAKVLGVDKLGAESIDEFQAQHDAAREVLDGVRMSAVSIFDRSFIRAYTDGGTFLTRVMADAGVEFVPAAADIDGVDGVGRVQLSLEQLGRMQGDMLLLLQRPGLEDAGVADVADSPVWPTLPAVQDDAVITLDRLGYPGAAGAAAFAADLAAAVAALR